MFKKILIGLALAVGVLCVVIATRPSEFRVARSAAISAPPSMVFAQVNDLHNWEAWSPWGKLDPEMKKTYSGAPAGTGASYAWVGNNQVGEGSTTITESRANEMIKMKLEFLKPFKGTNDVVFTFQPEGDKTIVTWAMSGHNNFMSKAVGLFLNCEKMVGGQFEQGLSQMRSVVEKP